MAQQAMASMAGLRVASPAVAVAVPTNNKIASPKSPFIVRDQQVPAETNRRAVLGLVATGLASASFAQVVLAEGKSIKVGPPPPPSGGLPGTLNSDEPRDLELPYKERFFLQPLTPAQAAARAKESAKDILGVKNFIEKNAWPYVQNDLRLKAEYLRYDLNTVISSMSKEDKKNLKNLTGKLFQTISNLDYAAKIKSSPEAEKYYAEAVSTLNDVLAKLG